MRSRYALHWLRSCYCFLASAGLGRWFWSPDWSLIFDLLQAPPTTEPLLPRCHVVVLSDLHEGAEVPVGRAIFFKYHLKPETSCYISKWQIVWYWRSLCFWVSQSSHMCRSTHLSDDLAESILFKEQISCLLSTLLFHVFPISIDIPYPLIYRNLLQS